MLNIIHSKITVKVIKMNGDYIAGIESLLTHNHDVGIGEDGAVSVCSLALVNSAVIRACFVDVNGAIFHDFPVGYWDV